MEKSLYNVISLFDGSGKSDACLEKELNLPRSIIYDWRNGRSKSYKKYISEIAAYFNVSTDYLLGNEQKNKPALTEKDEHDIKNKIEELLNMMSSQKGLMFDGDPLTPEALESIKSAMILGMTAATLKNKEKYNPNKNKKASANGRNESGKKPN